MSPKLKHTIHDSIMNGEWKANHPVTCNIKQKHVKEQVGRGHRTTKDEGRKNCINYELIESLKNESFTSLEYVRLAL